MVPLFWPSDSQMWFTQVQAQFSTHEITNHRTTMFDYVIVSLALNFAAEILDLILTSPAEHQYDILKEILVKGTAASNPGCLQQLFSDEELGDQKPYQLLCQLQHLAGDTIAADEAFFKNCFNNVFKNSDIDITRRGCVDGNKFCPEKEWRLYVQ